MRVAEELTASLMVSRVNFAGNAAPKDVVKLYVCDLRDLHADDVAQAIREIRLGDWDEGSTNVTERGVKPVSSRSFPVIGEIRRVAKELGGMRRRDALTQQMNATPRLESKNAERIGIAGVSGHPASSLPVWKSKNHMPEMQRLPEEQAGAVSERCD